MNKIPAGVPQGSGCCRAVDTHFQYSVGNRDRDRLNRGGGQHSWLEPKIMVLRQKGVERFEYLRILFTHEGPVEFGVSSVSSLVYGCSISSDADLPWAYRGKAKPRQGQARPVMSWG